MDEFDEKDALWNLLGSAGSSRASPYFVRKVLRTVREDARPDERLRAGFLRWLVPAFACVVLVIAWSAHQSEQERAAAEFNAYFNAVADLPSLVAQENPILWEYIN